MSTPLHVLDTNILLRFLIGDVPKQLEIVDQLFQTALPHSLFIPDIVLLELYHVLLSQYQVPKNEVIEKMRTLISSKQFSFSNKKMLKEALAYCQKYYKLSFADAYLIVLAQKNQFESLYSFDKLLVKAGTPKAKIPTINKSRKNEKSNP